MPPAVCQLVILFMFKVTSNHKGLTAGH